MLIVPTISWIILSHIENKDIISSLDFDLNEKRLKATLSETLNINSINVELENYYNDRIPFRSILITFKKNFDDAIEKPYREVIEKQLLKIFSRRKNLVDVNVYTEEIDGRVYGYMDHAVDLFTNHALEKDDIDPYDDTIEYPLKVSENGLITIGQNNWLYLNVNNIPYYTGNVLIPNEVQMGRYVSDIVNLNEICKKMNKKLVILMCPEKEEIYPEYMPTLEIRDDKELPIYMRDYLRDKTDVSFIYPKEEFLKSKKDYVLYKKYDSHWNYVGAYIALTMVEDALGIENTPLYNQSLKKYKSTDGDLISLGGISTNGLSEYTDYEFDNYKKDHDVNTEIVIDKIDAWARIHTCDKGIEKKAIVIGDSYSGAFVDFAKKDYKTLAVTSYMNLYSSFLDTQVKEADDIILVFVERNESNVFKDTVKRVYNILSKESAKIKANN